jgi:hypothetical protein
MRLLLPVMLLLLTASLAYAAPDTGGVPDEEFTTKNFGTVAVFTAPRQIANPDTEWWGEKLATEISSNPAYLLGIVNSRRMDKGIKPLLDPADPGLIYSDTETAVNGGYEYTVNFLDMRPSEVQAIIDMLGGPAKVLPGTTGVRYRPLIRRYMWGGTYDGSPVRLTVAGQVLEFAPSLSFDEVRARVNAAFVNGFGHEVPFDLTVTRYSYMNGSVGLDISINADMDPQPLENYGEGGM